MRTRPPIWQQHLPECRRYGNTPLHRLCGADGHRYHHRRYRTNTPYRGRCGRGPDGLEGPVYQYLSAQLSGMTDDEVKEATFSFRVSAAWLNAEKLLPADIALWRFHDNEWHELPTSLLREENGWAYYEATTPGFSSFAIAASDGQKVTVTTDAAVPGGETKTDTANISVTGPSGNETASEPQVTVAVPEEGTGTPTGTTPPQESPLGLFAIIGGGAAGAALLSRKR
ncbi:PGF-pre-PGF domain-containing protein [Methanogenium cariaci]|uniref:PGF-pre-PGF domain-containing protein n=1 Tax=Methanogenium cariaci TaxID=2197 RepID=UPI0009F92F44|nr:PGF-pre-PGF domain-containing protein [Methanogenium cariaci]